MSSRREEVGIFSFDGRLSLSGPDMATKVSGFNTWVNERLANGARVKSVTQCAAANDHHVITTITVVIEHA